MASKLTFVKTLIRNVMSQRSYSTKSKPSLYSKISPLRDSNESVAPKLDEWVSKGNKVSIAELNLIIRDLRRRKRFSQALQIYEWMIQKEVCKFRTTEHAVQMDLIGKVRGFAAAEEYFDKLEVDHKDLKTHGALLNCYARHLQTEKALAQLRKMQEMGIASSALDYNAIMCLYTKLGQHEKVPGMLAEMKENNVSPDIFSYRVCINSYGARSDPEGIDEILKEVEAQPHIIMDWNTYAVVADSYIKAGQIDKAIDALKKSEEKLDKVNAQSYNFLISLNASVGRKDEVLRLCGLQKSNCTKCTNKDYMCILASLVKLGEFEEAEKIVKEWETSGNFYDFRVPQTVIVGYSVQGLFEKAESLLKDLLGKGKATNPKCLETVAAGYARKGEMGNAFECMKLALNVWKEGGRRPNEELVTTFLSWLGDEGSVEDAEAIVESLRKIIPVNRAMYHALLKAYIRGGEDVKSVVDRMKADNIDDDHEHTKSILEKHRSDCVHPFIQSVIYIYDYCCNTFVFKKK